ncbi:KpsF/GutQ family sugar-phosphate isomerase [Candidatus Pelagibacter sp.]|nr:KpsF/GutQ family sugar-phosphate isomerase [Candidatus Pelagibacter sp.]
MSKNFKIAKEVIDLKIHALNKLKKSFDSSFSKAVNVIANCQSKIILVGVGKSGLIAAKIASTLSSVGSPSFSISANDCSHGDLGTITKKDILILISNSGNSTELKNIIEFANRYKVKLISIVSKKDSMLYKSSDIKILIPPSREAGYGIVPTTSTTLQLSVGDALAISVMKYKKFSKLDFKKFHPAGSLGFKLKTVEDLMLTNNKIPIINQDKSLFDGVKLIEKKKLGILIAVNKKKDTVGVFTDGDVKRVIRKNIDLRKNSIKKFMTKNPVRIEKDTLAVKALNLMNQKKITSLCVYKKELQNKTIGIIHIHNILNSNIK